MNKRNSQPVIDVTDLYHPYQDPGDNLDLVTAYALPEIDLRAAILDATDVFRAARADHDNPHYQPSAPPRSGVDVAPHWHHHADDRSHNTGIPRLTNTRTYAKGIAAMNTLGAIIL